MVRGFERLEVGGSFSTVVGIGFCWGCGLGLVGLISESWVRREVWGVVFIAWRLRLLAWKWEGVEE